MKMINTIKVIIIVAGCSANLAAEEMVRPRTMAELKGFGKIIKVHRTCKCHPAPPELSPATVAVTIRIDSHGILPRMYLLVPFTLADKVHYNFQPGTKKLPITIKFVIMAREPVPLSRLKEASSALISRMEEIDHDKFIERIIVYDRMVFHQDWATFLSDDALRPPGYIRLPVSPERPRR